MGHLRPLLRSPLSLLLTVCLVGLVVAEEVVEGDHQHQNSNPDFYQDPNDIRTRRDVLKGKDHDLIRSKRYIGRIPYSYMKKIASPIIIEPSAEDQSDQVDHQAQPSYSNRKPVVSHFREYQLRPIPNKPNHPQPQKSQQEEPRVLTGMTPTHKAQRRYVPSYRSRPSAPKYDEDVDLNTLSEDDLQSLLSYIEAYDQSQGRKKYEHQQKQYQQRPDPIVQSLSPQQLQYYIGSSNYYQTPVDMEQLALMQSAGKRETGKRSVDGYPSSITNRYSNDGDETVGELGAEQPMSFDNAQYQEPDNLEFLGGRNKRVGAKNFMAKNLYSSRQKKETDPEVTSALNRLFSQVSNPETLELTAPNSPPNAPPLHTSNPSIDGSKSSKMFEKKSIDWTEYLGVDKRSGGGKKQNKEASISKEKVDGESSSTKSQQPGAHQHSSSSQMLDSKPIKASATPTTSEGTTSHDNNNISNGQQDKKQSIKKVLERQENETENKEEDKDWLLKEFYKNFAMSTNIKRKRESPSNKPQSEVEKLEALEKKMAEAGDEIIWDTLKYTGAHRDEQLTPKALAQVKNNIIQKISTAYTLEKVREAVEQMRAQIVGLENKSKE